MQRLKSDIDGQILFARLKIKNICEIFDNFLTGYELFTRTEFGGGRNVGLKEIIKFLEAWGI